MGGELEESKALLDAAVRGQRQVEQELSDTREQGSDMQGTCDTNIKQHIDNFHVMMNQLALHFTKFQLLTPHWRIKRERWKEIFTKCKLTWTIC